MTRSPDPDRQIFFVLCDYGRHGLEWVVRDPARMGRKDTIAAIRSGELRDVVQVIELNVAEFSSRDVTEDILGEVSFDRAMTAIDNALNFDRQPAAFDHRRDLRKHEVA